MTHFLTTNPSIKMDQDVDLNEYLNNKDKLVKKPESSKDTVYVNPAKPEDDWSERQQKEFEAALKKYPSSLSANERWSSISNCVDGKTKKQCVDRYKYLSSLIKKK